MFFGRKKLLGLDIGSSSIKMVELEVSKRQSKLVSFAIAPTPPSAISGGEILDNTQISQVIQALHQTIKTKRNMVATGIWGNAVIVKKINLPSMELSLLGEQIRWEAEQYIPYDVQEINLEYHILKSRAAPQGTMDLLLVAARKDLIFNYVESVELSGVQCTVLDVSGFALANCFTANYGELPGEVVAVLDIGSATTNFVVIDNGEVVFSRDVPVGGGNYTNEIQRVMNISVDDAEGMKLDASNNRPVPQEVTDIIQSQHEILTEEISKSIEFYTATSSDFPIQKLYLTGGGAQTPGLKSHIHNVTQIPVEFFNPLMGIEIDRKKFTHEYITQIAPLCAVSIGLGLREVGDR